MRRSLEAISASCFVVTMVAGVLFSRAEEKPKESGKVHQSAGTVISIDQTLISVLGSQGKSQSFQISRDTVFGTVNHPRKASDFKVKDRVIVIYDEEGRGNLTATSVRHVKPKPATLPDSP